MGEESKQAREDSGGTEVDDESEGKKLEDSAEVCNERMIEIGTAAVENYTRSSWSPFVQQFAPVRYSSVGPVISNGFVSGATQWQPIRPVPRWSVPEMLMLQYPPKNLWNFQVKPVNSRSDNGVQYYWT